MFDNVPIEKRWKVIIGIIGFAFVISLFYGKQVLDIYDKVEQLEGKTALIEDADLQIVNRQVRLKQLSDEIRQLQQVDLQLNSHVAFMDYVEKQCAGRGLELIALPVETMEDIEGYQIAHVDFAVEGMFHDMLGLMYQMEATDRIGSVARVDLERRTIRLRDGRKDILVATLRVNRLINERKLKGDDNV